MVCHVLGMTDTYTSIYTSQRRAEFGLAGVSAGFTSHVKCFLKVRSSVWKEDLMMMMMMMMMMMTTTTMMMMTMMTMTMTMTMIMMVTVITIDDDVDDDDDDDNDGDGNGDGDDDDDDCDDDYDDDADDEDAVAEIKTSTIFFHCLPPETAYHNTNGYFFDAMFEKKIKKIPLLRQHNWLLGEHPLYRWQPRNVDLPQDASENLFCNSIVLTFRMGQQ